MQNSDLKKKKKCAELCGKQLNHPYMVREKKKTFQSWEYKEVVKKNVIQRCDQKRQRENVKKF